METKHKKYDKYKPSGIEWLGEVPEHWDVKRLKYMTSINDEALAESTPSDYEILYVDIGNVDSAKGITKKELMVFEEAPSRARRIVQNGDTIVSTVRTYLRAIAPIEIAEDNLIVSTGFAVVRPREINSNYLSYALRSPYFVETVVSRSVGVSYPAINASDLATIEITFPNISEQEAIADFLDRRMCEIDELIAKKERVIELLREKRTALISHAVTKGLNPDAKMRDSGIDWLGDVPEHWELKKLKYLVKEKLKYGANESAELDDPLLPRYIRITDFGDDGKLRDDTFKSLPQDKAKEYLLGEGDILFARSGATVGKTFQFKSYDGIACFAGYLIKASPDKDKILSDFAYYYTKSNAYDNWKNSIFIQATIQNIGADKYQTLLVTQPSLNEQTEITDYLNRETAKIDALMAKVTDAIEKLKEYRTALISVAVTGKICITEQKVSEQKKPARRATPEFKRTVLAAEIVCQMHTDNTFGRVKFQKCLYLTEHILQLSEFKGHYHRDAAGPLDNRLMHSVEGQMKRLKWFEALNVAGRVIYVPMEKVDGYKQYFQRYWGNLRTRVQELIEILRPMNTEQAEIVATLFAAWNDLIIIGKPLDDSIILDEVLNKWHPQKADITRERWLIALDWMRNKGLVPQGYGETTIM